MGGTADISVVITTYNRPQFLIEAIESALRQTRSPREVIIIDDGSREDTAVAVRQFGSSVRYVRQENAGQQVARNLGVSLANSRWVGTLDDDDRYLPTYIEGVCRATESNSVDIIYTNHIDFDDSGLAALSHFDLMPVGYWDGIDVSETWSAVWRFPAERFLDRVAFFPSCMTVEKDFYFSIGGYDPRMRSVRAEDIEFLIRAVTAGRLGIVWAPEVAYRKHAHAQTAASVATALSRLHVFETVYREHSLTPAFKAALEADLPRRRGHSIDQAFRVRDFSLLLDVASRVDTAHWSVARRTKWLIANLGQARAKYTMDAVDKVKNTAHAAIRHGRALQKTP